MREINQRRSLARRWLRDQLRFFNAEAHRAEDEFYLAPVAIREARGLKSLGQDFGENLRIVVHVDAQATIGLGCWGCLWPRGVMVMRGGGGKGGMDAKELGLWTPEIDATDEAGLRETTARMVQQLAGAAGSLDLAMVRSPTEDWRGGSGDWSSHRRVSTLSAREAARGQPQQLAGLIIEVCVEGSGRVGE